jgi:hypothetical protein
MHISNRQEPARLPIEILAKITEVILRDLGEI